MKTKPIILVLILLKTYFLFSQNQAKIFVGDIEFTSQKKIEYFEEKGYTKIEGNVKIGNYESRLKYSGLNSVTNIQGNLTIYGNTIETDLLSNLKSVNGYVSFSQCKNCSDANINGLNSLKFINKKLSFGHLGTISIKGFNELTNVGEISIGNSAYGKTIIEGFNKLKTIRGDLNIPRLVRLNGFTNLVGVNGYLKIHHAPQYINKINGFNNLTYVDGYFSIKDYYDFDMFPNLKEIGGDFSLETTKNRGYKKDNRRISIFNNLETIEGDFLINIFYQFGEHTIEYIDGFKKLFSVEGVMEIKTSSVKNIYGFNKINGYDEIIIKCEELEGINMLTHQSKLKNVTIQSEKLDNINDFINIKRIYGSLNLKTPSLLNINGLSSLSSVDGNLFIFSKSLKSLKGLNNLTSIAGNFTISNTQITNLNALNKLSSIGIDLTLERNSLLTNIDGLKNLNYVSKIAFFRNKNLDSFCVLRELIIKKNLRSVKMKYNGYNPSFEDLKDEFKCFK